MISRLDFKLLLPRNPLEQEIAGALPHYARVAPRVQGIWGSTNPGDRHLAAEES
jgi:hypothetical protein